MKIKFGFPQASKNAALYVNTISNLVANQDCQTLVIKKPNAGFNQVEKGLVNCK